jgi:type II secretory pathway pseudopilin PulG
MRASNLRLQSGFARSTDRHRSDSGISLMETMVAVIVGSILLYAVFSSASAMYVASTANENQVLASNMAQQVIDNARDSSFGELNAECNGGNPQSTASGSSFAVLNLYGYTASSAGQPAMFARPLLRDYADAGLTYSQASKNKAFPGTVTEYLTVMSPYVPQYPEVPPNIVAGDPTGAIQVQVVCAWNDSKGKHTYTTQTVISQTGIHN